MSPELAAWLSQRPCIVCGASPCDPAHLPRVRRHGDERNVVSLCHPCHRAQHQMGVKTFAAKHGLNLAAIASQTWEEWLRERARLAALPF